MADLDWFPVEPGRYLKNTLHLTARQHGAYLLWIFAAFEARGDLPGTDAGLMSIGKLTAKDWKEDGPILKAFLTREGGKWVHEFARHLRADAEARVAAKSKAGKEGAEKRWNGRRKGDANGNVIATPPISQWQTDAHLQEQGQKQESHAAASSDTPRALAEVDEAFGLWASLASDLKIPDTGFLNVDRRAALHSRLHELGGVEGWALALEKVRNAEFFFEPNGKPKRWLNLGWLLKPENFTGLMEGRYAERHRKTESHSGLASALSGLVDDDHGQRPS